MNGILFEGRNLHIKIQSIILPELLLVIFSEKKKTWQIIIRLGLRLILHLLLILFDFKATKTFEFDQSFKKLKSSIFAEA